MADPYVLPPGLPAPIDDGAADQLAGLTLPPLGFESSQGPVELARLAADRLVLYVYPRTGKPGEPLPDGWNEFPGARGCTPQSCAFRDHAAELAQLGANLAGLSAQTLADQIEFAERTHITYPVIADPELQLAEALGLPTFEIAGLTLYRRLALVAEAGMIVKVFYPVFPPDRNAGDVLDWLRSMNLDLVATVLEDQPAYRVRQVWEWASRGAGSYAEMTNLPTSARSLLDESAPFSTLTVAHEARSSDGTVKVLFHTHDGHPVEAVLMRYRDGRRSVCLSSQSGCPLTCTFCATGQMRFRRNLDAWEILDQALHFRRVERIDHVVFMGMGEPMLNVDAVLAAARRLPDLGVTHRRTTISTVGWLPGLKRFVDEVDQPIRLALSLHAPTDALRSELMPVNDRYPLEEVLAECRRYVELRRRKVFVEYVMLAGVNDAPEHARALADVLDKAFFKVNLIPYNPTGMFDGSSRERIAAFKAVLDRARLPATVRLTRGRDIAAACGQLAATA